VIAAAISRTTLVTILGKLAASPWALSLTSFALTALLIRSGGLQLI
jgi:hypothetical protein